jgi:hypothetical protein
MQLEEVQLHIQYCTPDTVPYTQYVHTTDPATSPEQENRSQQARVSHYGIIILHLERGATGKFRISRDYAELKI